MSFARLCGLAATLLFLHATTGQDAAPDTLPLRLIVVNSAAAAEQMLQQLDRGADFAVLAREKSQDATAIDGGFMGNVDPATLRVELREALRGVAPGKTSRVFQLPTGHAIVKVLAPGEMAELESAQRARQIAAANEGKIQFDFDISGLNETQAALAAFPKPDDWYLNLAGACQARTQSLAGLRDRIEKLLGPATHRQPYDTMSLLVAKGQVFAYRGEMDQAIEQWELAYRMAVTEIPRAVPYLEELLGIGYLHRSEMFNGVYRNPGERCLFPIAPSQKLANPADSAKAAEFLQRSFQRKPDDLEVRWLLNLAHMTLGTWPAGVPKGALIPPSAFASAEDLGRFTDVAAKAGLNLFSMAAGIIVDDLDGDGLFDVVTSSFDMCAPMHFFHNNGDGTFADRSAKSGLATQLGGLNIIQADYNNDGCTDILVMRGGWEVPQRKSLLRNNCDGTFTDVTAAAGLAAPATSSQTAVWADINNDGLLDLFVGNENRPNQLFLNQGNGIFKDIAHSAGMDQVAFTKGVVAADYDHDGYMDFYLSNYRGDNALYRNNHDGTFTDIARQAGVTGTGHCFAAWFFDYDNDGWPDIFVTGYNMSVAETARTYLGLPHNAGTLKLYRNLGNGAFRDVTAAVGLDKVFMPMGANFGDIDNDGYPDIYLGTGDPSYSSLLPNILLHNRQGKAFVDVTASSGTGELHKGHGVAFADIDSDGDEDLLTVIGGAAPGDSHAFRLFENPGHGNDWISVRLRGVQSNRSAIGARIRVLVKNQGGAERSVYRTVGSGGSFGASPLEQHIGLGKAAEIVALEVIWPGRSEAPQKFFHVGVNQAIEIRESAAEYTRIARRPTRLGGATP